MKAIDDPEGGVEEDADWDVQEGAVPRRHEKITFERFVEFGPSPDCVACSEANGLMS